MQPRTIALAVLLGTIVVLGMAVASQLSSLTAPAIIQRAAWRGPVHLAQGAVVLPMAREDDTSWQAEDRRDQAVGWLDIVEVRWLPENQMHWYLACAGLPPDMADLDRLGRTLSYGLVFETTGDGVADYEVGLSNEAPEPGDLRVWVTNLATGETEQQFGPPYGFPVEFSTSLESPDMTQPSGAVFTFLGGSVPRGLTADSRFYAWSAIAEGGNVVAWDFAPDAAWLAIPPEPGP